MTTDGTSIIEIIKEAVQELFRWDRPQGRAHDKGV